jgi:hypothetical protein
MEHARSLVSLVLAALDVDPDAKSEHAKLYW